MLNTLARLTLCERLEYFTLLLRRHADTGVLDLGGQPEPIVRTAVQAHVQTDAAALCKLDSVSEQIDQDLIDLSFIRDNVRHRFSAGEYFELQRLRLGSQAEHRLQIAQQFADVE
jgi:hypothetical protein